MRLKENFILESSLSLRRFETPKMNSLKLMTESLLISNTLKKFFINSLLLGKASESLNSSKSITPSSFYDDDMCL